MKTQTSPENHPRTGCIDMTNHGITFKSHDPKWIAYAFSPVKGDTKWFRTYEEAKAALDAAEL